MVVILEGPDGGGKTTLAKQLSVHLGLEYRHEGPPPPKVNVLHHYGRLLESARDEAVIFDRLALGERVYGPLLRGDDRLGAAGWEIFHRLVTAVDAFSILCLPTVETCVANWRKKTDDLLSTDVQVRVAHMSYASMHGLYTTLWDQHVYDYERPDAWETLMRMMCAHQGTMSALPAGMIGGQYARALFVGEQVGDITGLDLPFFTNAGSAAYFWHCLDLAGVPPQDVALMNAFRATGEPNVIPQFERIVALGDKAHAECERQGLIEIVKIPHPQYWKRFHFKEDGRYASIIREAAQVACL